MAKKIFLLAALLLVGSIVFFSRKIQEIPSPFINPSPTVPSTKVYVSPNLGVSFNYPTSLDGRLVKIEEDASKIYIFTEDHYRSESPSKVIEVLTAPSSNLISFIKTTILKSYSLSSCQIKILDDRSITKVGIFNVVPPPKDTNSVESAIAYGKYIRKCPDFYTNYPISETDKAVPYLKSPFPLNYFLQSPNFPTKIIHIATSNPELELTQVNYWEGTKD